LRFLLPDMLSNSQKDIILPPFKIAYSKESYKKDAALFPNFLNCKSRHLSTISFTTNGSADLSQNAFCKCALVSLYVCMFLIMVIRWWLILFPKPWALEKHNYPLIYYVIPKYVHILHSAKKYTEAEHSTFTEPITPI